MIKEPELISVIIPVYNAEKTVEKCVKSVLMGTYKNIEVIIVNDGSTDSSKEIIENIAKSDGRVKIIQQDNKGVAAARNLGLSNISGKYVAWVDADDWVEDDWLSNSSFYLEHYNADICICGVDRDIHSMIEDEDSNNVLIYKRNEILKEFLIHKSVNGVLWNKLFKSSLFWGLRINENLKCFEDASIMWELLKRTESVVRYFKIEYHYSITDNSITNRKIDIGRVQSIEVLKEIRDDCILNMCEFSDLANSLLLLQAVSNLSLMIRDNYYDKKAELEIHDILKQNKNYIKYLSVEYRWLSYMACISMEMTRVIARVLRKILR